mmetsp:Transcript_141897/g.441153  ORF Transcript_141897/g.441153 Transcript_141897/m.441153 type:complete len:246 (+) Transcript_141897:379-1116(+)
MELQRVPDALQQRELREVRCGEGGGAGGVADEVGTLQVEDEAEPVRGDGQRVVARRRATGVDAHRGEISLVQTDGAAPVVRRAVGDLLGDAVRVEQGAADLQDLALQRVHARGLVHRDLEVLVVKQVEAFYVRGVLLNRPRRSKVQLVGIMAEVELHIEPGVGNLHGGVTTSSEPGGEHLRLVPAAAKLRARRQHRDPVADGCCRPAHEGIEDLGIALPARERELRALRQEACHHGEHLALGHAL